MNKINKARSDYIKEALECLPHLHRLAKLVFKNTHLSAYNV